MPYAASTSFEERRPNTLVWDTPYGRGARTGGPCKQASRDGRGGRGRPRQKTHVREELFSALRRAIPSIHLSSGEAVLGLHGRRERLACMDRPYGARGRTARAILTYWVGVLQDVLAA